MNKRLAELAEQAGFEEQTHFIDSWECGIKELECFAELVRQDYLRELKALKPVAFIENHKAGQNLSWSQDDLPYAKATPLYALEVTK